MGGVSGGGQDRSAVTRAPATFALHSTKGLEATIGAFGATLLRLRAPDRRGRLGDVVLGFDDPREYLGPHPYLGGIVGRFANRIAEARFVLDGHCADLLVVAARREGSTETDDVSLLAIPASTAGVERRALPTLDQTRRLAALRLDEVRVPRSMLLGEEGGAAAPLRRTLDLAAVALAAEQVGGAQRCLDLAVEHAKSRVQFGRPIGSFQAIQHKCADMLLLVESARSASQWAACVAAEDPDQLALAASLAKAYCSEAYFRCAAECLQIHGGVGFTWEYDVHLHLKRAQGSQVFLGDPAWHRERVAQRIGL